MFSLLKKRDQCEMPIKMQMDADRERVVAHFSFSVFFNVENNWDVRYITQRQFHVRNVCLFFALVFSKRLQSSHI